MSTPLPLVPSGTEEQFKARRLVAEFLVTTPMFIGDGMQQAVSIRPPSLKGALRFWWRALQWPRLYQQSGANQTSALERLHQEEAALFGLASNRGAKGSESGGKARFNLRVEDEHSCVYFPQEEAREPSFKYLLGQGLFPPGKPPKGGLKRHAIKPDSCFAVILIGRLGRLAPTDKQWKSLEQALLVFGLLGGLGSRARKGLGSVSIQSLTGGTRSAPGSKEDYCRVLEELLTPLRLAEVPLPPFTAFSGKSRLDISLTGGDAMDAMKVLNELGNQQQLYRSYRRNDRVNGQQAKPNFSFDHDDVLEVAKGDKPVRAPQRMVFGLPHNYHYSSIKVDVSITPPDRDRNRRGSPLFSHIHQFSDGSCLGVQLILPAVFLHSDDRSLIFTRTLHKKNGKKDPKPPETLNPVPNAVDWTVLYKFLDRFNSRKSLLSPAANPEEPR